MKCHLPRLAILLSPDQHLQSPLQTEEQSRHYYICVEPTCIIVVIWVEICQFEIKVHSRGLIKAIVKVLLMKIR